MAREFQGRERGVRAKGGGRFANGLERASHARAVSVVRAVIVISVLLHGCALERKLAGVVPEADVSTVDHEEIAATVDAKSSIAFCYIVADDSRAIRLTINPGPFSMSVICGSDLRFSVIFSRSFEFVAEPGHDYRMEYEFYRCMRLVDATSTAVISDTCKPYRRTQAIQPREINSIQPSLYAR